MFAIIVRDFQANYLDGLVCCVPLWLSYLATYAESDDLRDAERLLGLPEVLIVSGEYETSFEMQDTLIYPAATQARSLSLLAKQGLRGKFQRYSARGARLLWEGLRPRFLPHQWYIQKTRSLGRD
jgi:hypothetical protein